MSTTAEVLYENSVDLQDGMGLVLLHDHVTNCQGADITAVLEVPRIQGVLPYFVENLASIGPWLEQSGVAGGGCSAHELVFCVFLRASDYAVLYHLFHRLENVGLRSRHVHNEPHPILQGVFFVTGGGGESRKEEEH